MNTKKACAVRRKPFSGFGGFRFFGSAEAESINAVFRQKTDGVISSARRRSKKEKPSRCRRPERNMRLRCCRIFALRRNGSSWRVLGNIRPNAAAPEGFCASLYQTLCKKAGKGQAGKGCRKPDCLRPTPTECRRAFPCHSGAFLLCPFFLWASTAFGWVSQPPKRFGGFCLIGTGK